MSLLWTHPYVISMQSHRLHKSRKETCTADLQERSPQQAKPEPNQQGPHCVRGRRTTGAPSKDGAWAGWASSVAEAPLVYSSSYSMPWCIHLCEPHDNLLLESSCSHANTVVPKCPTQRSAHRADFKQGDCRLPGTSIYFNSPALVHQKILFILHLQYLGLLSFQFNNPTVNEKIGETVQMARQWRTTGGWFIHIVYVCVCVYIHASIHIYMFACACVYICMCWTALGIWPRDFVRWRTSSAY